jgi:tyrosyl-tRNA synthetase
MSKELEAKIEEILTRGVGEFIDPDGSFKKKLIAKAEGKYDKDIIIKYGVDPTRPDIHLGHAVCFRKLRQLQDLGCKVVFLIGDFTAMIGDPSGKDKVRPTIHLDEVRRNMKTYLEQVDKILLVDEKHFSWITNSDWYVDVLDMEIGEDDITTIEIPTSDNSNTTVSVKGPQLLAKADIWNRSRIQNKLANVTGQAAGLVHSVTLIKFIMGLRHLTHAQIMQRGRFKERKELFMHEMMYPVLQGIDSNVIYKIYSSCDLELGGTDQIFNMLIGRDIMESEKQNPQAVIALKLLEGTDGVEKMSKSLDNYIGITEEVNQIFGKVMSLPDILIAKYFELCTDIEMSKIKQIEGSMESEAMNPRDAKLELAVEIVKIYHGDGKAKEAKEYFINTFSKKEIPQDILEIKIDDATKIVDLIVLAKFATSKSDARRKIEQGGVSIDGEKIADVEMVLDDKYDRKVMKVGKIHFVKIRFK